MDWIDVENKLPDTDIIVLVKTDESYALARYHDNVNGDCYWQNFNYENSPWCKEFRCQTVLRWMPIPNEPNE